MSKRKLLLADDSVTIQKVVNLTFADGGIEVVTANDGAAAMKKFVEFAPDLVMADVNLPGLNGYEICEQIKQNTDTQIIPVVLLVGSFEPFDQDRAKRAGADDYLTKPFQSIGQLVDKVSALLNIENGENISPETAANSDTENLENRESRNNIFGETSDSKYGDRLGKTGTDDEITQTDQIGSLPADEAQKFETKFVNDTTEDFTPSADNNLLKTNYKDADEYETVSNFGAEKTKPLSAEELSEITSATEDAKLGQLNAKVYESVEDQNYPKRELTPESELTEENQANSEGEQISDRSFSEQTQTDISKPLPHKNFSSETISPSEADSFLSFDDTNILETSPFQKANAAQTVNFSPELVDAIADKIIEKLFEKIIREVAEQVVEQKADLIIKQVAEERLKE
ncbi:MAG: response regulator [Acidobacteriota bacterium]|nr:response regulator [Acidobacteriota bacterium]